MLGSQAIKSSTLGLNDKRSPPKLQKLLRSESTESIGKISGKLSRNALTMTNKIDDAALWFERESRDYFPRQDGSEPKPAQNIARLGGKRYIVVPKNNAMAVQPAITARPDKMQLRPPFIDDDNMGNVNSRKKPTLIPRVINENASKENKNNQENVTKSGNTLPIDNSPVLNQQIETTETSSANGKCENTDKIQSTISSVDFRQTIQTTSETNHKIDVDQESENQKIDNAQVSDAMQTNEKSQDDTNVLTDVDTPDL